MSIYSHIHTHNTYQYISNTYMTYLFHSLVKQCKDINRNSWQFKKTMVIVKL